MAKFKDSGNNLKFSDIVDHFTSHVSQEPIEHKISEYYKGGRYIAEKKNQYHIYPDTIAMSLKDYPFPILLVTSNAVPQIGDKVRLFDASGNPLSLTDCPIIGQIFKYEDPYLQQQLSGQAVIGAYPLWSNMSEELKETFNGAYFISFSNQQIGNNLATSHFKLNTGDKTGVVTEWADRLGRARAVVVRATGPYTDGVNNDNPSNIPIDISDDDEGTEIKFSDFYGGYAKVDLDERETSKTTSRTTSEGKTIEFSTNYTTSWQTATLVQSTFEKQTSINCSRYAGSYQTSWSSYYGISIQRPPYQAQTIIIPGGQQTRQAPGGGSPYQWPVSPVRRSTTKQGYSFQQANMNQTSRNTNNPDIQVQTSWTTSFDSEVVAQTATTRQTSKQTSSSFNSSWQTSWSTEFDTTFSFWN